MPRVDIPRKRVEVQVRVDLLGYVDEWAERMHISRSQVMEMLLVDKVRELEGFLSGVGFPAELPELMDEVEGAELTKQLVEREFEGVEVT